MLRVLSFLLFSSFCLAQGEANIWYFGQQAGLDFNNGAPVALTDGQMPTPEACATISDSSGQLLFYTSGYIVWNKLHQIMPNGTDLLGHTSSTQGALIIPKPGSTTIYYIFTTTHLGVAEGARYSEVDMSLNGGLGDVTENKNILLHTPVCEKMTAVKNGNNTDYWVVIHGYGDDSFLAYSVTASGVNTTPVVSNVGMPIAVDINGTVGSLKFSPDGTKLLCCIRPYGVELFDFDFNTGIVSNAKTVSNRGGNYGAEFSPNGELAYITNGDYYIFELVQYDLTQIDIPSTAILLHHTNNMPVQFGALQIAPDGKIYAPIWNRTYISRINNPDVLGIGCDFELNAVDLETGICQHGLPQFIQSYFNASFTFQNTCFGDTTQFTLTGNQTVTSVNWDFGDGSTAAGINPSHTYSLPGTYTVTATITGSTETITKTRIISIVETPVANPVANQSQCSLSNSYNLSQHAPTLLGSQSNTVYEVEFYNSFNDAENNSNKVSDPVTLNQGNNIFFAKVFNLSNRQCYAITSFNIEWFQQPLATQPNTYIICENLPYDNTEIFNLVSLNQTVLNGQSNSVFTVTYHLNLTDATSGQFQLPNNYQNTSPTQTLYIRVTNINNFNCYATTSFQIQVIQQPTIQPVSDFLKCDDIANNSIANFDLNQKTTEILNGQPSSVFQVAYFLTQQDADTNTNPITTPIDNTTNPQTIYYSIAAISNTACKSTGNFLIRVSELPTANLATDLFLCDNDNDSVEWFNLQSRNSEILGNQNAADFQISYHLSQSDAEDAINSLPLTHQNISNPQTIFARIQNVDNSECFDITDFTIGLYEFPIANTSDDLILCDDQTNDGFEVFDLQVNNNLILGSQSAGNFSISYYKSLTDAQTGTNSITTNYTNETNPQTIYARIENNAENDCFDITAFSLIVRPSPQIDLAETYTICEGVPITINAPIGFTTYNWSTGSTVATTVIDTAGTYYLTVTMDYGNIVCSTTKTIEVENSNIATILGVQTVDWTDSQNSMIIYVEGDGDYEYSLDGINYQDSNQFFGLPSGDYTVFVNDKKECGYTTKEVFLLMYPKFFTPNNDGHNDFWKIKFSETEPNLQVFIFDRYGKIITGFKGNDIGWDGTLNGQNLPSSDYWFVVKRENGKEYKGHFSLKR
ncbi:MAG TPA: T9SS type B sorting domain-containing protein [Flavobacterium sp.]|uniref:T9SS type B sorting domain-containing protein n=1 Tax=unclassified Flavobacterium TaxID=196869 RepID=UPI0025BED6A9|nr:MULTISPECIES: T9SS type B sorting domain-containing protein [unclassified Flavobacterium]HRE76427.1 T9SS type B sorting domain-containing protein [Flavobacterium sp.]